jgi:hypothetical protein
MHGGKLVPFIGFAPWLSHPGGPLVDYYELAGQEASNDTAFQVGAM